MKIKDIIPFIHLGKPFFNQQSFKIQTAYKISKIIAFCDKEASFYDTQLSKIIAEYAEKDSDGNIIYLDDQNIKVPPDKTAEAQQKINELLEVEIDDKELKKLTMEELSTLDLTIKLFETIKPFLEE